jgi:hypothetical protein
MGDLTKHPAIVLTSLLLGFGALLVAVISLVQSCGVESEQERVTLGVEASADRSLESLTDGLTLTVSFANQSLRPIIIRDASLWRGDQQVGEDDGYTAPERGAERHRLPFTLAEREGRTIWLRMRLDRVSLGRCFYEQPGDVFDFAADGLNKQARRECKLWEAAFEGRSDQRLRLRVKRAPGDVEPYPVSIQEPAGIGPTGWGLGRTGWVVNAGEKSVPPRTVVLGLGHDGGGPEPSAAIARLDLWREADREFRQAYERPVVPEPTNPGTTPAVNSWFPLPGLERGSYEFAFSVEGRTVVTGCFQVPFSSEELQQSSFFQGFTRCPYEP